MENSKLTTAILAGAAIGGAIWYLTKTSHGKECLNAVLDTAKTYGDKMKSTLNEKAREVEHLSKKASEYMADKASEATKYAKSKLDDANGKIQEAKA
ncbi:HD/KH domain protein [Pseudopedobacter saltans DSM 12145]|uniref:HD/KH domain protein n=1 Tax=Pseudopedobacter saltans (strain ATCC 51119 / DSM 12145 / JCM 21818 / CCUG 39354 / LMG 10337 / NBRC 100064 / NCIMB 13643) TaxID=762903 RepID=F0S8G8_PSESL|nr:YtxH domain-containing protein [Pseudopedobacter saltans]ADY53432.1 HD/KH domain protein [Pseudopedobacter saltans DSM 12145]